MSSRPRMTCDSGMVPCAHAVPPAISPRPARINSLRMPFSPLWPTAVAGSRSTADRRSGQDFQIARRLSGDEPVAETRFLVEPRAAMGKVDSSVNNHLSGFAARSGPPWGTEDDVSKDRVKRTLDNRETTMTDKIDNSRIDYLKRRAGLGRMSRREFIGRMGALGVGAAMAGSFYAEAVLAQGPKKGGHLKLGLGGGESSNSLDPALTLSQAPYNVMAHIGEPLVRVAPDGGLDLRLAEEISASPDARVWSFKIRQGIEFHNGKTMTSEDVLRTMQRHSDEQ